MATINVILQAKARDKGVHKWLTEATKLADGLGSSLGRAKSEMRGLGSVGAVGGGGRSRGGGGARAGGGAAGDADPSFAKAQREAKRSRERTAKQEARDAERQVAALARSGQQRVRASQRAAKNLEALSDDQLREREIQREINARRSRAARAAAQEQLGPDATRSKRKAGPFGKLEFAENLAVAGGEFEQFGDKVEGGIRGSFDAFKDYQKKVAEIGTITEAVSLEQIDAITKAAVGEFGGAPIRQAEALQKIMSTGAATAEDAQAQLTQANKLALAGSADVTDSVVAISKTLANFKGAKANEVADSIFAVTQASSAEVGDVAQALPRIAAGAAAAGLSLQETIATMGHLSDTMPDANQAVTGMIQALSNISKPTKAAIAEAQDLGLEFSVAGIEAAGGWEQFLLKIRASKGFDENTLTNLFGSVEARNAIAAIMGDMEKLHKNMVAQKGAAGGVEKAYAKMADTTAQKAALVEGQWELLKIQAGEELMPAVMQVADYFGSVVTSMQQWIKNNPNLAATIANVAVGTVVLTKGVGALLSVYAMWQTLSGITQLGNMKLAATTTTVTTAVTKQTTAMSLATKVGGGMKSMVGALPLVFAGAAAAIVAFDIVLDQAQKALVKYEDTIKSVEEEQKNISFSREATSAEQTQFEADKAAKIAALQEKRKRARGSKAKAAIDAEIAAVESSTMGPVQKTDAELLMERRNRLISVVNASRTAVSESRVGGVDDDANLFQTSLGGWGGMLNAATGVTEELERQQAQAELDLARFDQQYGAQLNLGESAFAMPSQPVGLLESIAVLQELVKATQTVASNTAPKTTGPSMEAGMS